LTVATIFFARTEDDGKEEKLEFVMPPQDGAHLKDRFRQALLVN
jgi:hypothetical protein